MQTSTLERPRDEQAVQGVRLLEPREVKLQRRMVLIATILPFVGLIAAIIASWGWGITGTDFAIFFSFYVFTGLGVTVGYHRLLTHGSFKAKPWLRAVFAVAGSMSLQGSVIAWVADHRRHHAHSDQPGDPHSPHLEEGPGLKGIVKGLWHAHMGWLFKGDRTSPERWTPDLLREPAMVKIDKHFPTLILLTLTLPALAGFLLTGTLRGAITAFLWGSLVRIFLLHHVTWSINSICHFYGRRPFETTDHSTNNWPLALISFGESWHNNHHAFPTAAVHGLGRTQIDVSGMTIRALERLNLAWDVKTPSPKQLARKGGVASAGPQSNGVASAGPQRKGGVNLT